MEVVTKKPETKKPVRFPCISVAVAITINLVLIVMIASIAKVINSVSPELYEKSKKLLFVLALVTSFGVWALKFWTRIYTNKNYRCGPPRLSYRSYETQLDKNTGEPIGEKLGHIFF